MIRIVSVTRIREVEAAADASGLHYAQLMENAGKALATRATALLAERNPAQILVLVGAGNNGGDGLVAARLLAQQAGYSVCCYLLRPRPGDSLLDNARDAGAEVILVDDDPQLHRLDTLCADADLVIDALLGIGLRLPLRPEVARLLVSVGRTLRSRRQLQAPSIRMPAYPQADQANKAPLVLAVDCPSGLDCDSGALADEALPADETLTFIAVKPGLLRLPGALACGRLTVASAGVHDDFPPLLEEPCVLADAQLVRSLLPSRPRDAHKGTFGKLLIVGGSANYRGAPGLSALAAQRVGAGLVTVSATEAVISALAAQQPGVTWLPDSVDDLGAALSSYDALMLGPGWGVSQESRQRLWRLLDLELPPLVIDADGLNLLAEEEDWPRRLPPGTILTPHPGEMARLTRLPLAQVQEQRWQLAQEMASRWKVTLVLKGAYTLIASPDGALTVLPFCSDALARAGTGDVLAGAIGGLLAQGCNATAATIAGGYLQGLAGLNAAEQAGTSRSPLAIEVAHCLAESLSQVENIASARA